ncbi:exonuclease domain-containing protein [Celeribacter ethanolicus]|uniref:exonuclease domain-containing protein n=1 Tax=Celeribacter ethanolicus TaxID=1758178 RepID=UPI00082D7D4B|nr:exonuclease domain-containing protein [Celeribacter ethanolicus]
MALDATNIDFFTFDFETANEHHSSICQIGISIVEGGRVSATHAIDVNPGCRFSSMNISVHGITPERVVDCPSFIEAISPFEELFRSTIAISHSAFDKKAINDAYALLNAQSPLDLWLDSMTIVRRTWPEHFAKRGYGLSNLSKHFGIPFNHHDAGEDARITAEVLLRAFAHSGRSPRDWLDYKPPHKNYNITASGNEAGALFGQVGVFTGALTISRSDAAALAAKVGIEVASGVTKKTTLLIVGDQDLAVLAGHEKSSKHRKAEDLIAKGQAIRILGESEFLSLVADA